MPRYTGPKSALPPIPIAENTERLPRGKGKVMLSKKQKDFADLYMQTGNITQSALAVYDVGSKGGKNGYMTAHQIGLNNLKKPLIQKYIEGMAFEAARRIEELAISAKNESVRLNANKDIMDRAGFRPIERTFSQSVEEKIVYSPEQMSRAAEAILKTKRTVK